MQAVLNWVKQFLIIYFILTIFMHLAAADQYKKYLRFFSGIILLLVLLTPLLKLSGSAGRLDALVSYETFWEQLAGARQDAEKLEYLENSRYVRRYESAIEKDIQSQAQQQGIAVRRVDAVLTDAYEISSITVWLDAAQEPERAQAQKTLLAYLKNTYHLKDADISIS